MVRQETQTDAHMKKFRVTKNEFQSKGTNTSHILSKSSKYFSSQANYQQESKGGRKKHKLGNDDNCPIHDSSHKWG